MQGTQIVHTYHITGTLAANANIRFSAYRDLTLQHISAVASNDSDATLAVGISSDTDSILAAATIGDSNTPAEKDRDDWASTNPTGKLNAGEIFVATLDYDGSGGTAAQDVTLVFTFTEG